MADNEGRESALLSDTAVSGGIASGSILRGHSPHDLWLALQWLAEGEPVPLGIVQLIADGSVSANRRKRILMALHGRGLVDDRQLRLVFEHHPELVEA